jgi:hypothetical protein
MFSGRLLSLRDPNASAWWAVSDSRSADAAVSEMVIQLEMVGWPLLEEWLTPEGIARQVDASEFGYPKGTPLQKAMAQALLLMDRGPSEALDSALARCAQTAPEPKTRSVSEFSVWVRAQAIASRN